MKHTFRDLTLEEMILRREEIKKEYFKLRCDKVISHVQSPVKIRVLRRQIAQLNTLIYNHEEISKEDENSSGAKR